MRMVLIYLMRFLLCYACESNNTLKVGTFMVSRNLRVLVVLVIVALSGCGMRYMPRYEQVGAIPPGHVLVVSRAELKPSVKQQKGIEKLFRGQNAIKRGEVKFLTSTNVDKPVKKGSIMPFDVKGGYDFNVSFKGFSFTVMPAGTTYIRRGEVTVGTRNTGYSSSGGVTRGANMGFRDVILWGDVKVTIPAGVKAVYIGNLVYEHNGRYGKSMRVKDDYKRAKRALAKQKIPGIKSKDLKKELARVVRKK